MHENLHVCCRPLDSLMCRCALELTLAEQRAVTQQKDLFNADLNSSTQEATGRTRRAAKM